MQGCHMARKQLHLSQDPAADALLTEDPLALLIGMQLDQQFAMDRAFRGPYVLLQRLGSLDPSTIANRADLKDLFATPPVIHRFPGSMAGRVQDLCRHIVEEYDGDAERLWKEPKTGDEVLARLQALPGFGKQKAQIFVALLGKQRGVQPPGWEQAAGGYGEQGVHRSVADVVDGESLGAVRAYKQEKKAAAKRSAAPGPAGSSQEVNA
jgi:uncharacterized HhH-GPD family protein